MHGEMEGYHKAHSFSGGRGLHLLGLEIQVSHFRKGLVTELADH